MTIRQVTNNYYSGQGRMLVGKRNVLTGEIFGFRHVGNCTAVSVEIAVEKYEHRESTSGNRSKDLALVKSQSASAKFTCENLSADNLALGLYGRKATVAGQAVVDEAHTFDSVDAGIIPLKYPNVTTVTVKCGASVGTATAVTNTGNTAFEVDADFGTIYIVDKTKFTGANVYVSYTYGASVQLDVFTNPVPTEVALRFEGLNSVDGSKRLITIPRVTFDPLPALQLVNDEIASAEFTGNVLQDSFIDASQFSQFMTQFTI